MGFELVFRYQEGVVRYREGVVGPTVMRVVGWGEVARQYYR